MTDIYDAIIIGGGASGYFGAVSLCELSEHNLKVLILEATKQSLQKVKISGCLLYTSPSPRDRTRSRMPSSA